MWSVLLVFLSSLDRNLVKGGLVSSALDAMKPDKESFCSKVSSVQGLFLYEVSDGAEVVRSLVTSAGALVDCSINKNPEQVMLFTRECKAGHRDDTVEQQDHAAYQRIDESRLLCQRFQQSEKLTSTDQAHRRAKRGFTYPGTLWCGAGNMADNYNQLGDFAETDSCCRTHDHCPHVIHAFSSNYGYTNFKWHSISHCDCDETLKACLRKVNDTSSRVVGQAFFNVIEAPCFTFAYEEQCVERHWYGLCKRFEKRPIAVLTDAVPYDFGGIDIIDELTVAPSRKKDSNKSGEQVQSEPTSPSPVSGSQSSSPDEPSLRNVMTAAEDFIKVLATVSTSQSSTADSDKGDSPSSEKKKKKPSQKKKKTKKTKGKGRKKKKQEAVVKIEDGGAVPLSSPKEEGATGLSNFISEPQSPEQIGRVSNKVSENEYELGVREETSNEVMKDEPALEQEAISVTSPRPIKRKPTKMGFLSIVSSTRSLHRAKAKWLRNRQKKVKTVPTFQLETTSASSKPQDQSIVNTSERPLIVNTSPIEISEVKKNRSKLRKEREERNKKQKVVNENVEDNKKEGTSLLTTTPGQFSQDVERGRVHVTPLSPSFSVLKRQRHRSKEKGISKKKRKGQSLLNEHLFETTEEEVILPTPSGAQISPAITTEISRLMDSTQLTTSWQVFTTANMPSVNTKRLPNKKRGKLKNRSNFTTLSEPKLFTVTRPPSKPAVVKYVSMTTDNFWSPQSTTTSAVSALSPMQLTIEKVKEQFERKRKRKVALFSA
ncbi:muscle M-line assembly protein unc-89 [Boleophthalmus pectinirostris]|uniref:muscle M-line assembly protein unc-89 n=1 Tax=Boleophthalmus pectinirostris TaxID=150288 RepID=UPI00242A8058|nr:muscle M-line assembly protein unc-89 [Boleophthalmus pectinirostris]